MTACFVCVDCGRVIEQADVHHYVRRHQERFMERDHDRKPREIVVRGLSPSQPRQTR